MYDIVFLKQRPGVTLSLSRANSYSEQYRLTNTYNRTPIATDPRPVVLTALDFKDGPQFIIKDTVTATVDFKAAPGLVLSLNTILNFSERNTFKRNFTFTAAANGTAAATGRQNVIGTLTDFRTNGLASNTSRTVGMSGGATAKITDTATLVPKFEYKIGAFVFEGNGSYSKSKNTYMALERGFASGTAVNPVVAYGTRYGRRKTNALCQLRLHHWRAGRLKSLTHSLAAPTVRFVSTFSAQGGPRRMLINVGCSGWFYSHWRGIFYPRQELTTKNWFGYYANVFRTVELNAPFYRWPTAATVRRWKRDAPPAFVYSVKVNQRITHEKRMVRTKRLVESYYEIAPALGDKMGCFLFQFPPSYHFSTSRLKSIVAQLDPAYRNVVEFRHRSWWRTAVYRALTAQGIAFCAVSAPRLPEVVPPEQRLLYVRLSGRTRWYRHDYSPDELRLWVDRIRACDAEETWVYFNNDRDGFAIKNALRLRRMLRTTDGIALPATGRSSIPSSVQCPI